MRGVASAIVAVPVPANENAACVHHIADHLFWVSKGLECLDYNVIPAEKRQATSWTLILDTTHLATYRTHGVRITHVVPCTITPNLEHSCGAMIPSSALELG